MKIWVLTIKDFDDSLGLKEDIFDMRTNVYCFSSFENAREELRDSLKAIAHTEGIYEKTLVENLNEDIKHAQ
jgi:hypothetical protein